MSPKLYSLVYCSRNRIRGAAAEVASEIEKILASSRANNCLLGVTGALLYNDGNFAQVLEGPLASVEATFEKIQCDPRHSEVVVVQSGVVEERQFPEWSMAFAGASESDGQPSAAAAFNAVSTNAPDAGSKIVALLHELIVQEDDWILVDAI